MVAHYQDQDLLQECVVHWDDQNSSSQHFLAKMIVGLPLNHNLQHLVTHDVPLNKSFYGSR